MARYGDDEDRPKLGAPLNEEARARRLVLRGMDELAAGNAARSLEAWNDFSRIRGPTGGVIASLAVLEPVIVAGRFKSMGLVERAAGAAAPSKERLALAARLVAFRQTSGYSLPFPHNHQGTALVREQVTEARLLLAELALARGSKADLKEADANIGGALAMEPTGALLRAVLATAARVALARGKHAVAFERAHRVLREAPGFEPLAAIATSVGYSAWIAAQNRGQDDATRSSIAWKDAPRRSADEVTALLAPHAALLAKVDSEIGMDLDLGAALDGEVIVVSGQHHASLIVDGEANVIVEGDLDVDGVLERRSDAGTLIVLGNLKAGHLVTSEDAPIVVVRNFDIGGIFVGSGERWPTYVFGDARVGTFVGLRNHAFVVHGKRKTRRRVEDEVDAGKVQALLRKEKLIEEGALPDVASISRALHARPPA